MTRTAPPALLLTVAVTLSLAAHARAAHALAPLARDADPDDDHLVAFDARDPAAPPAWAEVGGPRAPLWIGLGGLVHLPEDGPRSAGVMVLIGLPLERIARRGIDRGARLPPPVDRLAGELDAPAADRARAIGDDASPLKPARRARPAVDPPPPPPPAPAPPPAPVAEPTTIPVAVTTDVARAAVRAALRRARLASLDAAFDGLSTRARASALLPELRLRALTRADDGQSLAPTEYDPARTTATTGQSLWLEARATWRLDRIVFADDEIAIERLRDQRAEAQAKLTARVLDLLFAWQRATTAAADPRSSPDERLEATLRRLEAESALDVATDGWFGGWLAGRP